MVLWCGELEVRRANCVDPNVHIRIIVNLMGGSAQEEQN